MKNVIGSVRSVAVAPIRKAKNRLRKYVFSGGNVLYIRSGYARGVRYTIPASNAFGLPDERPATLRQLVRGISATAPVRAKQTSTGRLAPLKPLTGTGSVQYGIENCVADVRHKKGE